MDRQLRDFSTRHVMALVSIVLLASIAAIACGWGWLQSGSTQSESNSTTIRNIGLLVGAIVAFILAVWRGQVSERQNEIAQLDLLNERYQKGAEMLGSNVLAVRLGGIYALQRLAEEYPIQYHIPTVRLLCAFICDPEREAAPGRDIHAAIQAIGSRSDARVDIEKLANYRPDLSRAALSGLQFHGVNLSGVRLIAAQMEEARFLDQSDLSNAILTGAYLSGAKLITTNLRGALFGGAILIGTDFADADLSGVQFDEFGYQALGLTQKQFAFARADKNNLPVVGEMLDVETAIPLKYCLDILWMPKNISTSAE